jgi:hypothetical protein
MGVYGLPSELPDVRVDDIGALGKVSKMHWAYKKARVCYNGSAIAESHGGDDLGTCRSGYRVTYGADYVEIVHSKCSV